MRGLIKNIARGIAFIAVLPSLVSYGLKRVFIGADRALEGSSQALSLVPGLPGRYMRQVFFSSVLARCSSTVVIEFGTLFSQCGAHLDDRVYIGPRCHLGLVHIGAYTMLGPGVQIPSGAHTHGHTSVDAPIQSQGLSRQLVHIGDGCWIGANAVIMADVGAHTIIGAGAVVTRPIPSNVVAAGSPARVIKDRGTGDVAS
jgi:acetyltransferase-like isoleucine patch superfamily enzyme